MAHQEPVSVSCLPFCPSCWSLQRPDSFPVGLALPEHNRAVCEQPEKRSLSRKCVSPRPGKALQAGGFSRGFGKSSKRFCKCAGLLRPEVLCAGFLRRVFGGCRCRICLLQRLVQLLRRDVIASPGISICFGRGIQKAPCCSFSKNEAIRPPRGAWGETLTQVELQYNAPSPFCDSHDPLPVRSRTASLASRGE